MKTYIKENKSLFFSLLLTFIIAFIYNSLTPYSADDFRYMFSVKDETRMTSIFQLIPSIIRHYQVVNGRTIAHFLVQLMLLLPKMCFNLINAGCYTFFVYLISHICGNKKQFHPLIFFAISILLWLYTPAYSQVFLWETGAINYYWSYLFGLLFMSFYIKLFRTEKELSRNAYILLCIFGFLFGGYTENTSFSVIFLSFCLLALTAWRLKNLSLLIKYTLPIVLGAAGFLTILLCPANAVKLNVTSPASILNNIKDILIEYYKDYRLLFVIFVVLLVLAVHYKTDKKDIILSFAFLSITLISAAMLSVAGYLTERSLGVSVVFHIIAIVQLMQTIRSRSAIECIPYCLAAYFLVNSFMSVYLGTYDIYDVWQKNNSREAYIENQLAQGETTVTVPIIYSETKYSCKYLLADLSTEEETYSWANLYTAKYYGLERIYGKTP